MGGGDLFSWEGRGEISMQWPKMCVYNTVFILTQPASHKKYKFKMNFFNKLFLNYFRSFLLFSALFEFLGVANYCQLLPEFLSLYEDMCNCTINI